MLTEREIAIINEILEKKHDVEIQFRNSGIAIISVRKDVKYIESKAKKKDVKYIQIP